MGDPIFDPMDPEFREDPYPVYARMRAESPVFRRPGVPFFAVSRYDDVLRVPGLARYGASSPRSVCRVDRAPT
jgi:cytochrome P450